MLLATINPESEADGIVLTVTESHRGYAVILTDLDAGEVFPAVQVFPTQAEAIDYALECAR